MGQLVPDEGLPLPVVIGSIADGMYIEADIQFAQDMDTAVNPSVNDFKLTTNGLTHTPAATRSWVNNRQLHVTWLYPTFGATGVIEYTAVNGQLNTADHVSYEPFITDSFEIIDNS